LTLSAAAGAQLLDTGPVSDDTPILDPNPGWAVGADVYGGIAAQFGSDEALAHSFAGGDIKFHWHYLQVGAFAEITDVVIDQWHTLGGMAGLYAPYSRWVDFDASLGLARRRYTDTDPRYGPGGYALTNTLLVWRLGVSDRSSESLFGGRVGAQLVGSIDLQRHDAPWRQVLNADSDDPTIVQGVTPLGGVSVGLLMAVGFDVGPDRTLSP
jgi:hypothetical protein